MLDLLNVADPEIQFRIARAVVGLAVTGVVPRSARQIATGVFELWFDAWVVELEVDPRTMEVVSIRSDREFD